MQGKVILLSKKINMKVVKISDSYLVLYFGYLNIKKNNLFDLSIHNPLYPPIIYIQYRDPNPYKESMNNAQNLNYFKCTQ